MAWIFDSYSLRSLIHTCTHVHKGVYNITSSQGTNVSMASYTSMHFIFSLFTLQRDPYWDSKSLPNRVPPENGRKSRSEYRVKGERELSNSVFFQFCLKMHFLGNQSQSQGPRKNKSLHTFKMVLSEMLKMNVTKNECDFEGWKYVF